MATIGTLTLTYTADTETLDKAIRKMNKDIKSSSEQMQQSVKKTASSFDSLASSIKKIAGIAGLGYLTYKVKVAANEWMKLSAAQQMAERELSAAALSVGRYSDTMHRSLLQTAKDLEKVSGYTDQAILQGMKYLIVASNITDDIMPRATRAMVDFAHFTGMEVPKAAKLLVKASMGMQGELRRLGVVVGASTYTLHGFRGVLDEISVMVGNQTKFYTGSYKWAWDTLKISIMEAKERLGSFLNILLVEGGITDKFTTKLWKMVDGFDELLKSGKIREFANDTIITLGNIGIKSLKIFNSVYKGIKEFFKDLGTTIQETANNFDKLMKKLDNAEKFKGKMITGFPEETPQNLLSMFTGLFSPGIAHAATPDADMYAMKRSMDTASEIQGILWEASWKKPEEALADNTDKTKILTNSTDILERTINNLVTAIREIVYAAQGRKIQYETGVDYMFQQPSWLQQKSFSELMHPYSGLDPNANYLEQLRADTAKQAQKDWLETGLPEYQTRMAAQKRQITAGAEFTEGIYEIVKHGKTAFDELTDNIADMFMKKFLAEKFALQIGKFLEKEAFSYKVGSGKNETTISGSWNDVIGAGATAYNIHKNRKEMSIEEGALMGGLAGFAIGGPFGAVVGGFLGAGIASASKPKQSVELLFEEINGEIELISHSFKGQKASYKAITAAEEAVQSAFNFYDKLRKITGETGLFSMTAKGKTAANLSTKEMFKISAGMMYESFGSDFVKRIEEYLGKTRHIKTTYETRGEGWLHSKYPDRPGIEYEYEYGKKSLSSGKYKWITENITSLEELIKAEDWDTIASHMMQGSLEDIMEQYGQIATDFATTMSTSITDGMMQALYSGEFQTFKDVFGKTIYDSVMTSLIQVATNEMALFPLMNSIKKIIGQVATGELPMGDFLKYNKTPWSELSPDDLGHKTYAMLMSDPNQFKRSGALSQISDLLSGDDLSNFTDDIKNIFDLLEPFVFDLAESLGINTEAIRANTDALLGPLDSLIEQLTLGDLAPGKSITGIKDMVDKAYDLAMSDPTQENIADYARLVGQYEAPLAQQIGPEGGDIDYGKYVSGTLAEIEKLKTTALEGQAVNITIGLNIDGEALNSTITSAVIEGANTNVNVQAAIQGAVN